MDIDGNAGGFDWEDELYAGHRWGACGIGAGIHHSDVADSEYAVLKDMHDRAGELSEAGRAIAEQICRLEICNYRLETSLQAICNAIGHMRPVPWSVGHRESVTTGRWRSIWAYLVSLRYWLGRHDRIPCGHEDVLSALDPGGRCHRHVMAMLGEPDELKVLRVERLCLRVEFILEGMPGPETIRGKLLREAARKLQRTTEAATGDDAFERGFGPHVRLANLGELSPCHHKLFRRLDILISSIGQGEWRMAIPYKGTDGFERADLLDTFLVPIRGWIAGEAPAGPDEWLANQVHGLLRSRTHERLFLAALLESLMRSQQVIARTWAEQATAMRKRDEARCAN